MIIYIYRFYYVFKEYFNKNYDNSLIFLAASRNLEPKLEKGSCSVAHPKHSLKSKKCFINKAFS